MRPETLEDWRATAQRLLPPSEEPLAFVVRETPIVVLLATARLQREEAVSSVEHFALRLIDALGAAGPWEVCRYLGIPPRLAQGLTQHLEAVGLTARGDGTEQVPSATGPVGQDDPELRLLPRAAITARGREVLAGGRLFTTTEQPVVLEFAQDPPFFIGVGPEHLSARRGERLRPVEIAEPLEAVLDALELPPAERAVAIGIGSELPHVDGTFVGLAASRRPEFRVPKSSRGVAVCAVLVRNASSNALLWRFLVAASGAPRRHPDAFAEAVARKWGEAPDVLAVLAGSAGAHAVRRPEDGVVRVGVGLDDLRQSMRSAGKPDDLWRAVDGLSPGWSGWVRLRPVPADAGVARAAVTLRIVRALRAPSRGLKALVDEAVTELRDHWGTELETPELTSLHDELWEHPDARRAICADRYTADLLDPYRPGAAQ